VRLARAVTVRWMVGWIARALARMVMIAGAGAGTVAAGPMTARAQEQRPVDLHGMLPAVPSGDPAQPLTVWAPPPVARGWSFQVLGEYSHEAVVVVGPTALEVSGYPDVLQGPPGRQPLLGDVFAVNLSGWVSPVERLGVSLTVPVFPRVTGSLASVGEAGGVGSGIGTVRAAGTLALVGRPSGEGLGVGLVPWFTVPGPAPALVTDAGVGGGALATVGYRADRVALAAHVGPSWTPPGSVGRHFVRRPLGVSGGAAAGVRAGPVWVHAEVRGRANVRPIRAEDLPDDVLPAAAPVEGLLTLTSRFGRSPAGAEGIGASGPAWLALGAGSHLTSGPSAAPLRAFAGLGAAGQLGTRERQVEPVLPTFLFRVVDEAGPGEPPQPVRDAEIVVGGTPIGRTGRDGTLTHQGAIDWSAGVEVRSPRHGTASVERPRANATEQTVELQVRPVPIGATVTDTDGEPVGVTLVARPLDGSGPEVRGAPGELMLAPGRYQIEVEGEGMATQVREIVVPPTGQSPPPLDVVALPDEGEGAVALRILDPEGNPVVGARVLVEGVPVGVTADGGWLEVRGLAEGVGQVEVQHPTFTAQTVAMGIDAGATETALVMNRVPGSVRVRARDPDGMPVRDAVVRFLGPTRLPAMALGPFGERTTVLSPGSWTAIVSSSDFGVQERDVEVQEGRFELITVDVVFHPLEDGTAELGLRVVDPSGAPIEGARVALVTAGTAQDVGTTSTSGTLRLQGLTPGVRELVVSGDDLQQVEVSIVLLPGLREHLITVPFGEGTVDVTVRGPDGPAPDAQVRFIGDRALPPLRLGPKGRVRTTVPPGDWTVVASSAELGVQERELRVAEGAGPLYRVSFVLAPLEGGVADLTIHVEAEDGQPVDQAEIRVDGVPVGTTASGGTARLTDLDVGQREIEVRADGFETERASIRLLEGDQTHEITLQASTGIAVRVHSGEVPVTDAAVRALGPDMRPLTPVDAQGEAVVFVPPDFWLLLVSSPTHGVAQQDVEVGASGVTRVEVELNPPVADRTDLVVTVIDPLGDAVEHARVSLDDGVLDQTAQGGTVMVRGLAPGPATLTVEAPDFEPSAPLEVLLEPGVSHYTVRLAWVEVPVEVRTVTASGEPVAAEVQWSGGPLDVAPVQTGPDGRVRLPLRPGSWRVFAAAEGVDGSSVLPVRLGDGLRRVEVVLQPTNARMAGDAVQIGERVQFEFGQATFGPDAAALLDQVARVISGHPELVTVEVQGHTDNVGDIAVNQALSQARADAVVEALVARGVARETLAGRGYGPTRPLSPNDTDEGRADNRRVQFVVLERAASR
jgi:outer membrane protein OmpA-like peptidoglycan-associated protein